MSREKTGQAHIALAFVIILLASGSIVIAQNISEANQTANETADLCSGVICETSVANCPDGSAVSCENTCIAGECIKCTPSCLPEENTSKSNPDQPNQGAGLTGPGPAPLSFFDNATEGNDTADGANETAANMTEIPENTTETNIAGQLPANSTEIPINDTEANTTEELPGNFTLPANETLPTNATEPSQTAAKPSNDTTTAEPATNDTAETVEEPVQIPEKEGPTQLSVDISYPPQIIRGETASITATITNTGNYDAKKIEISWKLPEGFLVFAEQDNCNNLKPNESCGAELAIESSITTGLGGNLIGMVLNYE